MHVPLASEVCVIGFTCRDLVHGIFIQLNMGTVVHKLRFLLLAVVLCVVSYSILTVHFEVVRESSMFGQQVGPGTIAMSKSSS